MLAYARCSQEQGCLLSRLTRCGRRISKMGCPSYSLCDNPRGAWGANQPSGLKWESRLLAPFRAYRLCGRSRTCALRLPPDRGDLPLSLCWGLKE